MSTREASGISVVIPLANSETTIRDCLNAIYKNTKLPDEVVVVDDGANDLTLQIAREFGCKVVKNSIQGISRARNLGVRTVVKDIIFFLDSDCILRDNAFEIIERLFRDESLAAIVGLQSSEIRFKNFSSQYKNLWMRHTYERLKSEVGLFYTSLAAIRRKVFLSSGGFDEEYRLPSLEDTDFGQRLASSGHKVFVQPELEAEHAKYYNLFSLLKVDFFRVKALIKLILRRKAKFKSMLETSVPNSYIVSTVIFAPLLFGSLISSFWKVNFGLLGALVIFLSIIFLNANFLKYLYNVKGLWFGARAAFFLPLAMLISDIGICFGLWEYFFQKKRY